MLHSLSLVDPVVVSKLSEALGVVALGFLVMC